MELQHTVYSLREKEKLTQIIGKMRAIGNIAKQLELMMQEV